MRVGRPARGYIVNRGMVTRGYSVSRGSIVRPASTVYKGSIAL